MVLNPKDKGTQQKITCEQCGGTLGEDNFTCPNCTNSEVSVGDAYQRKVQPKGKQFNPHSNDPHKNPMQVQRGVPIRSFNASQHPLKEATIKDPKEKSKVNRDVVPHASDDFLQCVDPSELPNRKKRRNVDKHIEEVSKSCLDLAIDG